MEFRKLLIEDRLLLMSYANRYELLSSNYTITQLFSWEAFIDKQVVELDNVLYIKFIYNNKRVFLSPLVKTSGNYIQAVENIVEYAREEGYPFYMLAANDDMVRLLEAENKYNIKYNCNYSEYIYSSESLISLSGKKLHSKRNYINRFKNSYDYTFRKLITADKAGVLALFDKLEDLKENSRDMSIEERYAMNYILDNMEALGLVGAVIVIDDHIVAATIGDNSHKDMAYIIFEKGCVKYNGIYPAINQMFIAENFSDRKYINRQEDMGIDGLRKAKKSYNPLLMLHNWEITLKENNA